MMLKMDIRPEPSSSLSPPLQPPPSGDQRLSVVNPFDEDESGGGGGIEEEERIYQEIPENREQYVDSC